MKKFVSGDYSEFLKFKLLDNYDEWVKLNADF